MTRWYRAYVGTVSDDKLAEVALIAGASGFELCGGSSRMRPGHAALITN